MEGEEVQLHIFFTLAHWMLMRGYVHAIYADKVNIKQSDAVSRSGDTKM
jgi:hypothetical protein